MTYVLAILALSLSMGTATAESLRVGGMPISYHMDREDDNEIHQGVFIEWVDQVEGKGYKEEYVGFMNFNNSFSDSSKLYYYGREWGRGDFTYGWAGGLVVGYDFPIAPVAAATMTLDHSEHLSSRLLIVPLAVVSYQLMYRIDL